MSVNNKNQQELSSLSQSAVSLLHTPTLIFVKIFYISFQVLRLSERAERTHSCMWALTCSEMEGGVVVRSLHTLIMGMNIVVNLGFH